MEKLVEPFQKVGLKTETWEKKVPSFDINNLKEKSITPSKTNFLTMLLRIYLSLLKNSLISN